MRGGEGFCLGWTVCLAFPGAFLVCLWQIRWVSVGWLLRGHWGCVVVVRLLTSTTAAKFVLLHLGAGVGDSRSRFLDFEAPSDL